MRVPGSIAALLVAVAVGLPAPATAAAAEPKVVVIVGPVGEVTDRYRAQGAGAAAVARRYTSNVVEVFSPNATWPAVRRALQGASLVVYLGHGNGWPSRYRDSLAPQTQNGFGLNPVAGGDDATHQYFGEAHIARDVKLAPDAVVVLSHLCYASGNTEPGLPEGTLDDARQRVDNYGAGFLAAGASAVLADAYLAPAYYVRQILATDRSVERIWRGAPSAKPHWHRFAGERTAGTTLRLNPARAGGSFYRSLVLRDGLTTSAVRAGAGGAVALPAPPPATLTTTGLAVEPPRLGSVPRAGSTTTVEIPFSVAAGSALPDRLTVGVRWDPIEVEMPSDPVEIVPPPEDGPSTTGPDDEAAPPDPSLLVQPESLGAVVAPVPATVGDDAIRAEIALPERPGLYRLATTLHDADGVAYDAETQGLLPALLVRVTGPVAAGYLLPPAIHVAAGDGFRLAAAVTNLGTTAWGRAADGRALRGDTVEPPARARIVARWIVLSATDASAPADVSAALPAGLEPGATHEVALALLAPEAPGDYLLLVDVVAPGVGSLAARGIEPGLVRVAVTEPGAD